MEKTDFAIGTEFYTTAWKWRCTDVGSRTIIAIKLGPHEIGSLDTEQGTITKSVQDDEGWLNGPPYAVEEVVFDENDLGGGWLDEE